MDNVRDLHIKRLTEGYNRISEFRSGNFTAHDVEFSSWKSRVQQNLDQLFGNDNDYLRRFQSLQFWDLRATIGGSPSWSPEDLQRFNRDLELSDQILSDALEELNITLTQLEEPQPNPTDKPLVFISYASDEVELADFLKQVLLRLSVDKLETFVAKRDISSGDNPLKVMLEEKLKLADAIIPICSRKAKNTSWVWWETASVWAKTGKLYPLFTNISPSEFGGPLILVVQGKDFFIKDEFFKTLQILCETLDIHIDALEFTDNENEKYIKLENIYSKNVESAHVQLGYDITVQTQAFHQYSLKLALQNKTESAFKDIVLELYFPEKYMDRKEWTYPHLHSSVPDNMSGYICLTFEYSNLLEDAKRQFSSSLLPEKTLLLFGKGGMSNLIYSMDNDRYHDVSKYEVKWTLYINGGAPEKGSVQFESLQIF